MNTQTQTSRLNASSTELSDGDALDFSARLVVALLLAYNDRLSEIAMSEDQTFDVPRYIRMTEEVQNNVIRLMQGEVLNKGEDFLETELRNGNKFFEVTIKALISVVDKIKQKEQN